VAKKVLSIFLLTVSLWGSVDIEALRTTFARTLYLDMLYEARYGEAITQVCKGRSRHCRDIQLDFIMREIPLYADTWIRDEYNRYTQGLTFTPSYWKRALKKLRPYRRYFHSNQFLLLADLRRHVMMVLFWDDAHQKFEYIGMERISAGAIERERETKPLEDHYLKTPTGIFRLKSAWRSTGEVLDDGVTMPYGQKNRFVYYFGKQKSIRYNTFDREGNKIRDSKKWNIIGDYLQFAIHAHQSATPLGRAASHGCIRITDGFNRYIEREWVLFAPLFAQGKWIQRHATPPPPNDHPEWAGKYLIVVDAI